VVSTNSIGSPTVFLVGLDETPSGTREDYRGALRHINGDSPFTQPPLKFTVSLREVAMMAVSSA
jgi:hypothetical protein